MSSKKTENTEQPVVDIIGDSLARAGKKQDEIEAVGTIDRAQTAADSERLKSGIMQEALLADCLDMSWFKCQGEIEELSASAASRVLEESLAAGAQYGDKVLGDDGKISEEFVHALARAGYWGLPIAKDWGGAGASKYFCGRAIITMSSRVSEIVGGLLSIERLIGAAGPLIWKGSEEQKERLLRPLAEGFVRSGFGGTEPSVGCNITKVSTRGVIEGEKVLVYGEKLFISNAWYGHEIALLLKIDGKLRVLITRLPDCDSHEFSIVNYGIHALRQIHNKGIRFNGLAVPLSNLLDGDGLSIIFHDLDEGRFAVAATAAARMRRILASCVPWVNYRETFGEKLHTRQYIQYLLALQAAYIAGSEALVDWSAALIDAGYQGDVSSMIAKTKATDWLRQCSTELGMFTHGGRFVLAGHTIGDNLADDLVSSVYEGPNPMLGKASVKAMAKAFGEVHLKPLLLAMNQADLQIEKLMTFDWQAVGYLRSSLDKIWKNRRALSRAGFGLLRYVLHVSLFAPTLKVESGLDGEFAEHLRFAHKAWFKWRRQFVFNVLRYQDSLADEDLLMLEEFYEPMAQVAAMLCAIEAARAAKGQADQGTVLALDLLCLEIRVRLGGEKRTSKRYKKAVNELAALVVEGRLRQLAGVNPGTILRNY